MLQGVERLIDLTRLQTSGFVGSNLVELEDAIRSNDLETLASTDGHFAGAFRNGQTVRLSRTIGIPLRYFVAKMFHGPFLIVADRIDTLFDWCQENKIGWQFDPSYTRMVPAHYLVEIDQIGCPDPAPRYHRFFNPNIASGSTDIDEIGSRYVNAAYTSLKNWILSIPEDEPIAIAFSGGIDSTSILIMALHALKELNMNTERIRAFTLDLGGGKDAEQAKQVVEALGILSQWEVIKAEASEIDLAEAIGVIEDYHPLDVECAAVALKLLAGIREKYPEIKYLLDGDGGDENMKSYPLEDSDLTLSSILRNPMLYQEGWGVHNMKHSAIYSGGLSRSYVRTFAPGQKYGFSAFSPYTSRSALAEAINLPFEEVLGGSVERLYTLKRDVVASGIASVTGISMPTFPKRRFQDGASDTYRSWKVSKAWCKQIFLQQWEEKLKTAWEATDQMSGNVVPEEIARSVAGKL